MNGISLSYNETVTNKRRDPFRRQRRYPCNAVEDHITKCVLFFYYNGSAYI